METAVHPESGQSGQAGLATGARPERGERPGEKSGALWEEAKSAVRAKINDQQEAAAKGVGDIAGALRSAAQHLQGREQPTAGRFTDYAADGLDQLSNRLRSRDLDGMVREIESFARNQPVAFFGAALAVGFLAVRFLKSGSDSTGTQVNTTTYEE